VLTGLEKISAVTGVPLEETTGITLDDLSVSEGLSIQATNLGYSWPQTNTSSLKGVSFKINASEKICLAGYDGSGKTTLLHVLLGMLPNYQGSIAYNGLSLRDLDLTSLRSHTSALIASDQLVAGTILQNIIFGAAGITQGSVSKVLALTNLTDYIHALPQGLHTPVTNFSLQFPRSICAKIVLARALVTKPHLLILDDYLLPIDRTEKLQIYNTLLRELTCTIIMVSNDMAVMQSCDRVLLLKNGTLVTQGSYSELEHDHQLQQLTGVVA
jgi:ABC-type multidrug transport system fused ATPase/permease subunit